MDWGDKTKVGDFDMGFHTGINGVGEFISNAGGCRCNP